MKDRITAGLLALFLGGLGVHKFYLNRPGQGIFYILFCWTLIPGLIALIESIMYFTQSQEQFDAKFNNGRSSITGSTQGALADLEKLSSLLEKGMVTQEEFDQKKKILMDKVR